jgi:hypothetical protein
MKKFLHSRDGASKGAALMIVLAFVVLVTGLALAYFSRAGTDRQLAHSSYNDTSSDLLARSTLDIVVNDFKQEILAHPTVTPGLPFYITPVPYTPPPQVLGSPIPNLIRQSFSGDLTGRTSSVNSGAASANGRSISLARWNSHYLIPRANASVDNTIDSTPVGLNQSYYSSFTAPDWVLVTAQGPAVSPTPSTVIGRYAFAVYDEGGLLDMTLAGYPSWTNCIPTTTTPTPTPWLVNVGRKGIVALADLTALPWPSVSPSPSTRIDNIVGWRNYAMTHRIPPASFGNFSYAGETDCTKQDFYGTYLLYLGDPPFNIGSLSDKLLASTYPFTSVAAYVSNNRTDQSLTNRQELLKLMLSLGSSSSGYNQNVLQYMGTFSRERNRPAPDWPGLSGALSEGRFNLNNLAIVIPNPAQCVIQHGKKVGWQSGKNKNKICGNEVDLRNLFGLFWITAKFLDDTQHTQLKSPGYWVYIGNTAPTPTPSVSPSPHSGLDCFGGGNQQYDFFQILYYALFGQCNHRLSNEDCRLAKTFAVGASLIDQYDSGASCLDQKWAQDPPSQDAGCDLDKGAYGKQYATHTTRIDFGRGNGNRSTAWGMELDYSDPVNGDAACDDNHNDRPHRPTPAPVPANPIIVLNRAFSNVGEFGYGIDTSAMPTPTVSPSNSCAPASTAWSTLKFWDSSPTPLPNCPGLTPTPKPFQDAPVLDFFSYNPISSAYPRAGIVNLYTKNAPVLAAILAGTLEKESASPSPTPVVSASDAMAAANAIIAETKRVLAGNPTYGSVQQTDLTRAIAGRLAKAAFDAVPNLATSDETKGTVARALAEMGQTRTWNLFIDVIAQTGRYAPNATDVTQANKFTVEGEKRYWLHISLGRDLNTDGTVDVLGAQLEEVIE